MEQLNADLTGTWIATLDDACWTRTQLRLADDGRENRLPPRHTAVTYCTVADLVRGRNRFTDRQAHRDEKTSWCRPWSALRKDMEVGRGEDDIAQRIAAATSSMEVTDTEVPQWCRDVAGDWPMIPAAIGGDPFSMMRRAKTRAEAGAVRVFLPLTCSTAVKASDFATVLISIVAALRALASQRPVELWVYSTIGCNLSKWGGRGGQADCHMFVSQIDIAYGDAHALALWCDLSVGRQAIQGTLLACDSGFVTAWGWQEYPTEKHYINRVRDALDLGPNDVALAPLYGASSDIRKAEDAMRALCAECGVTLLPS